MPDTRRHRGPHPEDRRLFATESLPPLRLAVSDLSLLLSRGYNDRSALKLVGDRHKLSARQRIAVRRSSCTDRALTERQAKRRSLGDLKNKPLHIDGYNVLIGVESALAGGIILEGRDGCFRDLASIHGSYRKVAETRPALCLVGEHLAEFEPLSVTWYLDSPVSNSGRLAGILRELAEEHDWPWSAELVPDPDGVLSTLTELIASSDSAILDRCEAWNPLTREVITTKVPDAWIVSLGTESTGK